MSSLSPRMSVKAGTKAWPCRACRPEPAQLPSINFTPDTVAIEWACSARKSVPYPTTAFYQHYAAYWLQRQDNAGPRRRAMARTVLAERLKLDERCAFPAWRLCVVAVTVKNPHKLQATILSQRLDQERFTSVAWRFSIFEYLLELTWLKRDGQQVLPGRR